MTKFRILRRFVHEGDPMRYQRRCIDCALTSKGWFYLLKWIGADDVPHAQLFRAEEARFFEEVPE